MGDYMAPESHDFSDENRHIACHTTLPQGGIVIFNMSSAYSLDSKHILQLQINELIGCKIWE